MTVAYTSDTFTRSGGLDGTSTDVYDGGSAATWAASGWATASGRAALSTGGVFAVSTAIAEDDYLVSVTPVPIDSGGGFTGGVVARFADANNYYTAKFSYPDRRIVLQKVVGGTFTGLWSSATGIVVDGDTLGLKVDGHSLVVYHNGVVVKALYDYSLATGDPGLFASTSTAFSHVELDAYRVDEPIPVCALLDPLGDPLRDPDGDFILEPSPSVAVGSPARTAAAYGPGLAFDQAASVASALSAPEAFGPDHLGAGQTVEVASAEGAAGAYGPDVSAPGPDQTVAAASALSGAVAGGPLTAEIEGTIHPPLTAHIVHRSAPSAVVVELDQSFAKRFQDQLAEAGSGEVKLLNDDPDLALLGDDDLIRFSVYGQAALTILAQDIVRQTIAHGEEAEQITTISGPGHVSILEEALVYPARGVFAKPAEEDRLFSWPSVDFDDGAWSSPAQIALTSVVTPGWYGVKDAFPPTGAYWIWAPPGSDTLSPGGNCYFRKTFTLGSAVKAKLYFTADDIGNVWLDGQKIVVGGQWENIPSNVESVDVDLDAGTHVIAIEVLNSTDGPADSPYGPFNAAGMAFALHAVDALGVIAASPLVVSDSSWKGCFYPPSPPGMTPGEVLRHCVYEAQHRPTGSALVGVTLAFTDEVDSNGHPWPVAGDISTKVGTDVLTFARELSATYIDFWMAPGGLTLYAWIKDGQGSTKPVSLHAPTDPDDPSTGNLLALEHHKTTNNSSTILARWNGGWQETISSRPLRKEVLLGLGAAQSVEEVIRISAKQVDVYANSRVAIRAEQEPIGPEDTPYLAYRPGDTITAPAMDGTPTSERCIAMTVAEDADGYLSFQPELKDIILDQQERFAQNLKKLANGTVRGDSKVATPLSDISGLRSDCCPPPLPIAGDG